jgi:hypothetical protein
VKLFDGTAKRLASGPAVLLSAGRAGELALARRSGGVTTDIYGFPVSGPADLLPR